MKLVVSKQLNKVTQKVQEMERKTMDLTKTDERIELMMYYSSTETYLRFRGIADHQMK